MTVTFSDGTVVNASLVAQIQTATWRSSKWIPVAYNFKPVSIDRFDCGSGWAVGYRDWESIRLENTMTVGFVSAIGGLYLPTRTTGRLTVFRI